MLGAEFGTSSFHISNFERVVGSEKVYVHGTRCPKCLIDLCKVGLAHPS